MTLPERSMRATQPRARNCASIHSARFCSKNVGAGMRQSCKCCSLIHCFSRANHWRASRIGAELAHSARNFEMDGGADGAGASLIGAAKCQFSSGWLGSGLLHRVAIYCFSEFPLELPATLEILVKHGLQRCTLPLCKHFFDSLPHRIVTCVQH